MPFQAIIASNHYFDTLIIMLYSTDDNTHVREIKGKFIAK